MRWCAISRLLSLTRSCGVHTKPCANLVPRHSCLARMIALFALFVRFFLSSETRERFAFGSKFYFFCHAPHAGSCCRPLAMHTLTHSFTHSPTHPPSHSLTHPPPHTQTLTQATTQMPNKFSSFPHYPLPPRPPRAPTPSSLHWPHRCLRSPHKASLTPPQHSSAIPRHLTNSRILCDTPRGGEGSEGGGSGGEGGREGGRRGVK